MLIQTIFYEDLKKNGYALFYETYWRLICLKVLVKSVIKALDYF